MSRGDIHADRTVLLEVVKELATADKRAGHDCFMLNQLAAKAREAIAYVEDEDEPKEEWRHVIDQSVCHEPGPTPESGFCDGHDRRIERV